MERKLHDDFTFEEGIGPPFNPMWLIFFTIVIGWNRSFATTLLSKRELGYSPPTQAVNPNRRIGVYYDQIEVNGYYGGQRFGSGNVSPFYQRHKNTTVVGTNLVGQKLVVLTGGKRRDLDEDLKSEIYMIDAKLRLRIRFKFGLIKSCKFKPKIRCDLKVPLPSSNTTSGFQFQRTKCDLDF